MKDGIQTFLKQVWELIKSKGWYVFLLVISTSYVMYYRFEIYELKELNARNLVFLLWLLLLMLPLFSEMEFLGIKVKKEVEKATEEIKESLQNMQTQISQMQVNNSIANHFSFGNTALPSEAKLEELLQIVRELQKSSEINDSNGSSTEPNNAKAEEKAARDSIEYSQDTVMYLAKVRCEIEVALRQLCEKIGYPNIPQLGKMLGILNRAEILTGVTCDLINQVRKIANRGIHGEIISNEYLTFVKTAYPQIMHQLNVASNQLTYICCPRCNFTGYSAYENVCPRCGFVNDED